MAGLQFDCTAQEVEIVSHPLELAGVVEGADVSDGLKKSHLPESLEIYTDPAPVRKASEEEPMEYSAPSGTPNEGSEPLNTDCPGDTEDGEAIIVGAVGSAAPWFLTGWTNDVEVEFMIDTGCQVTILATSVFEKMCTAHPQVKSRIRPCTRRLVSADSSPLTVVGQIDLDVVFPGLKCNMCCVVASIGSDGLLGMEALQSCLPHQLDLRTGQLWAEGRLTLQLHQQKPTPDVRGLLLTAVVLPPDSEVVAPFSLNGGHLGSCALIVPDRTGLACDPEKLSAVRNWHEPNQVKAVRQFVGFVGYYRRFVNNFAELADPLVALTRKGVPFVWGSEQQTAFDALKACLWSAPILGFPTEEDRFVLDTDASLFAIGGVLSQLQNEEEVVIAYASRSLRISQRRYCTTRRAMLAAVVMCTHFRSYLRGSQFTLRTDHISLRWLQKFKNEDGMLARWYLLLGQFSVMFEYRPGSQHSIADGMSRQCGQCKRPDCPVSAADLPAVEADTQSLLVDQPFASSEMGDSMDSDLLPELSGETWVTSALLEELTVDLPTA